MNQYKIKEIFLSIQGEGWLIGQPSVFVRFANCNVNCSFCDTDYAGGDMMTGQDIKKAIQKLETRYQMPVILTGGEPLLQFDEALYDDLQRYELHIETSGTLPMPIMPVEKIVHITMSPKVTRDKIKLKKCHTLKILWPEAFEGITPEAFIDYPTISKCIQPLDFQVDKAIKKLYEMDRLDPMGHWFLSPQLHRQQNFKDILR